MVVDAETVPAAGVAILAAFEQYNPDILAIARYLAKLPFHFACGKRWRGVLCFSLNAKIGYNNDTHWPQAMRLYLNRAQLHRLKADL
ncbi:MAG: hypothetical protein ACE5G8_11785, partial [Anaerolineae bacterium]